MQNFKGSCCSVIAFVVQTQLSGEERHCNAEVNFVRLLDDHPFHFGQQSDNDAAPSSIVGREPTSFANKSAVARMRLGRYKRW